MPLCSLACTRWPSSLSTLASSHVPANETSTVSPACGSAGGFAPGSGLAPAGGLYSPWLNHFSMPLCNLACTRWPSTLRILAGSHVPAKETCTSSPVLSGPAVFSGAAGVSPAAGALSPGLVSVFDAARNSPGLNHDSRPCAERARTRSPSIHVTVASTQLSPNLISTLSPTLGASARAPALATTKNSAPSVPQIQARRPLILCCDM